MVWETSNCAIQQQNYKACHTKCTVAGNPPVVLIHINNSQQKVLVFVCLCMPHCHTGLQLSPATAKASVSSTEIPETQRNQLLKCVSLSQLGRAFHCLTSAAATAESFSRRPFTSLKPQWQMSGFGAGI